MLPGRSYSLSKAGTNMKEQNCKGQMFVWEWGQVSMGSVRVRISHGGTGQSCIFGGQEVVSVGRWV